MYRSNTTQAESTCSACTEIGLYRSRPPRPEVVMYRSGPTPHLAFSIPNLRVLPTLYHGVGCWDIKKVENPRFSELVLTFLQHASQHNYVHY